ncbi:MAG TPA: excinuclease ABC subunit UvrC [Armatimonadota bacterium]|nr:excinuclease ABC subunit UvrC [Armatimonadota bacterium]
MNDTLRHKISQLPTQPGVYLMRDAARTVIYVGKAKVLKNRVRTYFGDLSDAHPRTQLMVSQVVDFDIIVVGSEMEALALEATLIKRYKPKYNVLLRDDKSYPYIKFTIQETYPKIAVVRGAHQLNDGSRYFGPYPNVTAMWDVVRLVRRVFKVRQETKNSSKRHAGCTWDEKGSLMKRPCLDFDIRQCTGPCAGLVTPDEYAGQVKEAILFLEGKMDRLITELSEQMEQAAVELRFETAARLRDKIYSLQQIQQDAEMVSAKHEDMDVVAHYARADEACMTVSIVRGGKLVDQQHYLLDGVTGVSDEDMLNAFLTQRYAQVGSPPRLILLQHEVQDQQLLADWLSERRGQHVRVLTPKRGAKADVVAMTANNAKIYLEQVQAKTSEEMAKAHEGLRELAEVLKLPEPPKRMECYDISTFQGQDAVGSMVVFTDGLPDKDQYRRFKIQYYTGAPDDYAMMREMLERRLGAALMKSRKFATLPDLMIIDGGKGQLGVALQAMHDLDIHVPVIGLAKRYEEIIRPGEEFGMMLPRHSRALHLLQCIRDEAHRFALKYHTTLRNKRVKESLLDDIPGIGPSRKQALLKQFGSVERIRKASVDEIAAVPGVTRSLAERIAGLLLQVDAEAVAESTGTS